MGKHLMISEKKACLMVYIYANIRFTFLLDCLTGGHHLRISVCHSFHLNCCLCSPQGSYWILIITKEHS